MPDPLPVKRESIDDRAGAGAIVGTAGATASPDSAEAPVMQFVPVEGVIDLGWGHPDPSLLPVEALRDAAARMFDRFGYRALTYGPSEGPGPLRAWICERLGLVDGRAPALDEVALTAGNSHGIDQAATLFAAPGDVVLVEDPTYHLAVRILRDHPVELAAVPCDEGGLRVDALADAVGRLRRAGRRLAFVYTIPTFHNPTGRSLVPDRRQALVDLAAAEGLLVLEDDAYRELSYEGPPPPSLWSIAEQGTVIRLGSFSKSLAPGLRVGYLTADAALAARVVRSGVLDSGGGISQFAALVTGELARSGAYASHVAMLIDGYRARRDALLTALSQALPAGSAWDVPAGGYFAWIRLPDGVHPRALLDAARARGAAFIPGDVFHLDRPATSRTIRVSFSRYPPDALREAARRLGEAARDESRS